LLKELYIYTLSYRWTYLFWCLYCYFVHD